MTSVLAASTQHWDVKALNRLDWKLLDWESVENRSRTMDGLQITTDGHQESQSKAVYPQTESAVSDANFGQWLTHHLSRLYDPVVNEPLPADLIRALESKLK